MALSINIIGAGIVGKTLAKLATQHKAATVNCLMSSNIKNAQAAKKFIGAGRAISSLEELHPADVHFITTPDEMIEDICNKAADANMFNPGSIILHCSGTVLTSALAQAKKLKCMIGRIHPIRHMHHADHGVQVFKDTYCVFEGDEKAYDVVFSLFSAIGAKVIRMHAQQADYKYHAAGVFAASYHQIVLSAAAMLYQQCGIEKKAAIQLSVDLAKTALNNIDSTQDYANYIEGPVKRMDIDTIRKNRDSIDNQLIRELYDALAKFAISLTHHRTTSKEILFTALETKGLL